MAEDVRPTLTGLHPQTSQSSPPRAPSIIRGTQNLTLNERQLISRPRRRRATRTRRTHIPQTRRPTRRSRQRMIQVPYTAGLATSIISSRTITTVTTIDTASRINPQLRQKRIIRLIRRHHNDMPIRHDHITDTETPIRDSPRPRIPNILETTRLRLRRQAPRPCRPRKQVHIHALMVERNIVGPRHGRATIRLTRPMEPPIPVGRVIGRPPVRLTIANPPVVSRLAPVPHLRGGILGDTHAESPSLLAPSWSAASFWAHISRFA